MTMRETEAGRVPRISVSFEVRPSTRGLEVHKEKRLAMNTREQERAGRNEKSKISIHKTLQVKTTRDDKNRRLCSYRSDCSASQFYIQSRSLNLPTAAHSPMQGLTGEMSKLFLKVQDL